MSLRRRIAGAAALAVAAVATTMAVVGYLSTRSHLVGELRSELRARAAPYLQPHGAGGRFPTGGHMHPGLGTGRGGGEVNGGGFVPVGPGHSSTAGAPAEVPAPPPLGGAPGYFQFVHPDGSAVAGGGGTPELPVDPRVVSIAHRASGSFYSDTHARGIHLEVLTVGDPYDHYAVQVALPLTGIDSVLHGLLLTYALLIAGGVLLAGLLGAAISRSALAPIERFIRRTESVTSSLDRPARLTARLEVEGASELKRLAGSFNQTLDALERALDAQRHLIADASHELRTPIASLRSDVQIFLDSGRLPAAERRNLQQAIVAELDELTQLVSDVLELARGSVVDARLESVELDMIVREAIDRASRRAPQLRWTVELAPTVIINVPDRVSRAVTNVIDNARKWSPGDGEIEVRLRDDTLYVRDHGPGFEERDLPHLFDRFYRAESARSKPGAGLGLAIVKQAAEAYGGEARAANAPGGGAEMTVSFGAPPAPAGRMPAPGTAATERSGPSPPGGAGSSPAGDDGPVNGVSGSGDLAAAKRLT
jgi:two-component system sensor histidine kinase MprB